MGYSDMGWRYTVIRVIVIRVTAVIRVTLI